MSSDELLVGSRALGGGIVFEKCLDDLRRRGLDLTGVDVANKSVDRDELAFFHRYSRAAERLLAVIDGHPMGAADADFTHLAGNESGVGGSATSVVRIPSAAIMPRRSSGEVSWRVRMTFWPFRLLRDGSSQR